LRKMILDRDSLS